MNTKKKLLSLLLAAVMVLSLMPTAFAEELPAEDEAPVAEQSGDAIAPLANSNGPTTLYVNGVNMLDSSESAPDGVTYDAGTATLTLNGATLDTSYAGGNSPFQQSGIIYAEGGTLIIEVKGDNKISYTDPGSGFSYACGIYFKNVDLTINGGGTLTIQNAVTAGTQKTYNLFDVFGDEQSNLTIDNATLKCGAGNDDTLKDNCRSIHLGGTLTVNNGKLFIDLRNTTGSDVNAIFLFDSGHTHKLTGNTEVTITAGSSDASAIDIYESVVQIGVGAKLRISAAKSLMPSYRQGNYFAAADGATLSVKGSKTFNDNNLSDEIIVGENGVAASSLKDYKTIEVTATAGGSTGGEDPTPSTPTGALDFTKMDTTDNSATAGWKWDKASKTLTLSGCNIEAAVSDETSDEKGAAIILPDGATITTEAGTNNVMKNTASSGTLRYGILGMGGLTIDGSGELSVSGKVAIFAKGSLKINAPLTATGTDSHLGAVVASEITLGNSVSISDPEGGQIGTVVNVKAIVGSDGKAAQNVIIEKAGAPTPTAPVFNDGLGNAVTDTSKYVKGTTKNEKGYTFAGWFDEQGKELTDVSKAVAGTAYTAKWTKDGKTVRTEVLDLTSIGEDNLQGATKSGNVYTNDKEGWKWDGKTLTLDGATFDVNKHTEETEYDGQGAIVLPDDAIVTTVKGTKNVVRNGSKVETALFGPFTGGGIVSEGALTINGEGDLSVVGGCFGISANGNMNINAPISVTCTETDVHVYAIVVYDGDYSTPAKGWTIKIDPSLRIKTPANGKIVEDDFSEAGDKSIRVIFVAKSDEKPADKEVVIGKASNSYYYYGGSTTTSNTPGKSPKTADAGIALYAGMAVASLLGSSVVFSRKRKIF